MAPSTVNVAVPVLPELVAVTVWAPATVAVQLLPVQLPLGAMENVVVPPGVPRLLSYWSRPSTV